MTYGEKIKTLRKAQGLTQKQFAQEIDVSLSAVAMYETDKRFPKPQVMVRIAKRLNVSIDYLYGKDNLQSKNKINSAASLKDALYEMGLIFEGDDISSEMLEKLVSNAKKYQKNA